jgi:hypothetical protein
MTIEYMSYIYIYVYICTINTSSIYLYNVYVYFLIVFPCRGRSGLAPWRRTTTSKAVPLVPRRCGSCGNTCPAATWSPSRRIAVKKWREKTFWLYVSFTYLCLYIYIYRCLNLFSYFCSLYLHICHGQVPWLSFPTFPMLPVWRNEPLRKTERYFFRLIVEIVRAWAWSESRCSLSPVSSQIVTAQPETLLLFASDFIACKYWSPTNSRHGDLTGEKWPVWNARRMTTWRIWPSNLMSRS